MACLAPPEPVGVAYCAPTPLAAFKAMGSVQVEVGRVRKGEGRGNRDGIVRHRPTMDQRR